MNGLFPNALTIARREYDQRVRTKSFLVVTVLLGALGLGLALVPLLTRALGGEKAVQVAVHVVEAGLATDPAAQLTTILNAGLTDGQAGFEVKAAPSVATARADVSDGRSDALLTITRGADHELAFDVYTKEGPTSRTLFAIRSAASQLSISDRLARAGIDPSQAGHIFAPTAFAVTPVDPNAIRAEDFGPRLILAYVLVILITMAVVTYGQWVASSVVEEKSSRVMELLVTAATPRQLLAGKVLGTGAAGLTQYAVIVMAAIGGLLVQGPLAVRLFGPGQTTGGALQALTPLVLVVYGAFFLGGFGLYATLYAALGSTASRQEDVQTVTGPLILIGMGGYFVSFAAITTIDASWVQVVSFIPFVSPYLIPARLILGRIAPWEILLSAVLLAAALVAAQAVAARLYSAGVLLYGQRVGLRSVWRATRIHR
jgi:ABC-2 type transport system permease protein